MALQNRLMQSWSSNTVSAQQSESVATGTRSSYGKYLVPQTKSPQTYVKSPSGQLLRNATPQQTFNPQTISRTPIRPASLLAFNGRNAAQSPLVRQPGLTPIRPSVPRTTPSRAPLPSRSLQQMQSSPQARAVQPRFELQQEHLPRRTVSISEPPLLGTGIQQPKPDVRLLSKIQPAKTIQTPSPNQINGLQQQRPSRSNQPLIRAGFPQPGATTFHGPGVPLLVAGPHLSQPRPSTFQRPPLFNQRSLQPLLNQLSARPPMHPHAPQLMSRQNQLAVHLRPMPPSPSRVRPMGPPFPVLRPPVVLRGVNIVRPTMSNIVRPLASGQKRKAITPLPTMSKRALPARPQEARTESKQGAPQQQTSKEETSKEETSKEQNPGEETSNGETSRGEGGIGTETSEEVVAASEEAVSEATDISEEVVQEGAEAEEMSEEAPTTGETESGVEASEQRRTKNTRKRSENDEVSELAEEPAKKQNLVDDANI